MEYSASILTGAAAKADEASRNFGSTWLLSTSSDRLHLRSRRVEGRARPLLLILNEDPVRRFRGGFECLRHDERDDLPIVPDLRRAQGHDRARRLPASREGFQGPHLVGVAKGENVENAGDCVRALQIHLTDGAARDAAGSEAGERRIGDGLVRGIADRPGHFQPRVKARDRLSHVRLLSWGAVRHVRPRSPRSR